MSLEQTKGSICPQCGTPISIGCECQPEEQTQQETTEVRSPEEVGRGYADVIPEADRQITTAKQVVMLIHAYSKTNPKYPGDWTITNDRFGNPPKEIVATLHNDSISDADKAGIYADTYNTFGSIKAMKGGNLEPLSKTQMELLSGTDKVRHIADSDLPESVKSAMFRIMLAEGEHNAASIARHAALENTNQGFSPKTTGEYLAKNRDEVRQADVLRRSALETFLTTTYPELFSSERMGFLALKREYPQPMEMETMIAHELGLEDPDDLTGKDVYEYLVEKYAAPTKEELENPRVARSLEKEIDMIEVNDVMDGWIEITNLRIKEKTLGNNY